MRIPARRRGLPVRGLLLAGLCGCVVLLLLWQVRPGGSRPWSPGDGSAGGDTPATGSAAAGKPGHGTPAPYQPPAALLHALETLGQRGIDCDAGIEDVLLGHGLAHLSDGVMDASTGMDRYRVFQPRQAGDTLLFIFCRRGASRSRVVDWTFASAAGERPPPVPPVRR